MRKRQESDEQRKERRIKAVERAERDAAEERAMAELVKASMKLHGP